VFLLVSEFTVPMSEPLEEKCHVIIAEQIQNRFPKADWIGHHESVILPNPQFA
jgi:hypothetical protein